MSLSRGSRGCIWKGRGALYARGRLFSIFCVTSESAALFLLYACACIADFCYSPLFFPSVYKRTKDSNKLSAVLKNGISDMELLHALYVAVGISPLCLLSERSMQPITRTRSNKGMTLHSIVPVSHLHHVLVYRCCNARVTHTFFRFLNVALCPMTCIDVGPNILL